MVKDTELKGEHFHGNNPDMMLDFPKPTKAEIDEMSYRKPITSYKEAEEKMSEAAKTAIADAYRHAATSAIMSKDRGKFTTQMLGLGLEGMDVISKSVGVLKDGKTPFFEKFDKMGNIFGDSSMDAYNNKLGLKYSGSKSDVLSALNIAFEKQLNRMKNPNYKFQENIDFRFDKR